MTTKPIKKSVKSEFCFPLELRLRVVDLLCFLFQPRGGLQTALKGHAGTLRQIHSQQIIPMEQAMVRPPSFALCIIHTMLSSRFHATTAQKNCLENKEKHDLFFSFFLANIRSLFFFACCQQQQFGGEKESQVQSLVIKKQKKERCHNTTATGPVVLLFFVVELSSFFHSRAAAASGSEPSASSPALHWWLLQATLRHEKIMTRNSAA